MRTIYAIGVVLATSISVAPDSSKSSNPPNLETILRQTSADQHPILLATLCQYPDYMSSITKNPDYVRQAVEGLYDQADFSSAYSLAQMTNNAGLIWETLDRYKRHTDKLLHEANRLANLDWATQTNILDCLSEEQKNPQVAQEFSHYGSTTSDLFTAAIAQLEEQDRYMEAGLAARTRLLDEPLAQRLYTKELNRTRFTPDPLDEIGPLAALKKNDEVFRILRTQADLAKEQGDYKRAKIMLNNMLGYVQNTEKIFDEIDRLPNNI